MKKIKIVLVVIGFLSVSAIAQASFFDDGRWYMDSSQWVDHSDGAYVTQTELVDQHNRLEWNTGSEWHDGKDIFRAKASKWTFDLNRNFEFTVGFHYNHTGTYDTDEGGIEIGLYHFDDPDASEPSHTFSISAENQYWRGDPGSNKDLFYSSIQFPEGEVEGFWNRDNANGTLLARYDALQDYLQLWAFSGSGSDAVGSIGCDNLRGRGLSQLGVYFAGWSEGASLATGDAYLHDFHVTSDTPIPEPGTMMLLSSLATGLFGFAGLRKKFKR